MKTLPAHLWHSENALAGVSRLSYIKARARSAPWNARVFILPARGDLHKLLEALAARGISQSPPKPAFPKQI